MSRGFFGGTVVTRASMGMVRTNAVSKGLSALGSAFLLGSALFGCEARTELADMTDDGDSTSGGTSSGPTGGTSSVPTGGTTTTGGRASTGGSATGGAADTGGQPTGGSGGIADCWEPTVEHYCNELSCPDFDAVPTVGAAIEYFRANGVCDESIVWLEHDTCGAEIVRYEDDDSSERYMFLSGTLGATEITRDAPFGPCNLTHYYGGIAHEKYLEDYGCGIVSRCVACGPSSDTSYPACRFDCPNCIDVEPGVDSCFGPETCECYCDQATPKAGD